MSNYSKITDFAAKDSLSTGNPAKLVKGVEIDDELVAISGAVASKADTVSPTFTGTTAVAALTASGAVTVSGATSLQAVTATGIVADTLTLDSSIVFEGATENDYETTLTITDPTADRTITFPDKTGTVAFTSDIANTSITTATGTYSATSSTTITVSITAHGRSVDDLVYLNFTSGTAADGEYTIASIVNANSYTVTHGTSITTTGNVTQYYSPLGQIRLASSAEFIEGTNTTKAITPSTYQNNKFGNVTAEASTSGTQVEFTSIPSWVKRISVVFNGVSTSGSSSLLLRIGDSGGIEASSYDSTASAGTDVGAYQSSTAGYILDYSTRSSSVVSSGIITLINISGNIWIASGNIGDSVAQFVTTAIVGKKTLTGTLDRVRITTVGGTDTFDAGSINILYE